MKDESRHHKAASERSLRSTAVAQGLIRAHILHWHKSWWQAELQTQGREEMGDQGVLFKDLWLGMVAEGRSPDVYFGPKKLSAFPVNVGLPQR